jgi:serine/threonine protein kinase
MALTPGTQLGHYEIIAAIGAGGMGEVYRARDPGLNREIAIKVLAGRFLKIGAFQRSSRVLSRTASLRRRHRRTPHRLRSAREAVMLTVPGALTGAPFRAREFPLATSGPG